MANSGQGLATSLRNLKNVMNAISYLKRGSRKLPDNLLSTQPQPVAAYDHVSAVLDF